MCIRDRLIIEKNHGPCKTARAINTDGEQLRIFDQFNLAEKVIANSNQIEKVHFSNKDLEPIQTIIASIEDTEMGWPTHLRILNTCDNCLNWF